MRAILVLLLLVWAPSAWGAQTVYTSRSAFTSALSQSSQETFETALAGTEIYVDLNSGDNNVASVVIGVSSSSGNRVRRHSPGGGVYVEVQPVTSAAGTVQNITVTLSSAVSGIGFDFIEQPINSGGGLVVTINGTNHVVGDNLTGGIGFWGVIDDSTTFTAATMSSNSPGRNQIVRFDNLTSGGISAPSTGLALLAAELPNPVDSTNGSWREIPDTEFTSWSDGCTGTSGDKVDGPCSGVGNTIRVSNAEADAIDTRIWDNSGSEAVIFVWNGAAYDRSGQKMYFMGGGHNSYKGNEVYEIDLSALTLKRLNEPSALTLTAPNGDPHPASGPQSEHTYDGLTYVSSTNELWHMAVGVNVGDSSTRPFILDLDTLIWTSFGNYNQYVMPYPQAFYEPNTDQFCQAGGLQLDGYICFDVSTRAVSLAETSTLFDWGPGVSIPWNAGSLAFTDNTLATGILKRMTITGTDTDITSIPINVQGGMVHRGNEMIFTDGQGAIYRYNIFTGEIQTLTPSGSLPTGALPSGGGNATRVYSKFVYLSEIDAFLMIHSVLEGIWLYCLPEGCIAPQAPIVTKTFEERCAEVAAVLYCNDFNDPQDLGDQDIDGRVARFHSGTNDCSTLVCPVIENGSLKFTISSQTGPNSSGQWFVDLTKIVNADTTQSGQSLFIQWKQKFDARMLQDFDLTSGSGGWKQLIVGAPDEYSCSSNEVVVQNTSQRVLPQIYHRCPDTGNLENLYTSEPGSDFDLQPDSTSDICSWNAINSNGGSAVGVANCITYAADEWMTFQLGIDFSAPSDSQVRLWISREGQAEQLAIDINWNLSNSDTSSGFGKVWFTPFHTAKDAAEVHVDTFTWYDELIIARNMIAHQ